MYSIISTIVDKVKRSGRNQNLGRARVILEDAWGGMMGATVNSQRVGRLL